MKEIKCPHCGKKFILNTRSLYKLTKNGKVIHYCSYNCWSANDTRGYNYQRGRHSQ